MLYAIGEILVFLAVAVLLGALLGWLVRGLFLRRRLERVWRAECERHRKQADLIRTQLNDCIRQRNSLRMEPDPAPEPAQPQQTEEETSEATQDEQTPDKASAQEQVKSIALRTAGGTPVEDDDLKKVRGIGPVLENLLKDMGISSYRQIANFTDDDMLYVAAALGSFPGRIKRDNWMQSAREEYSKKYGTEL